jgi:hypothetical protein
MLFSEDLGFCDLTWKTPSRTHLDVVRKSFIAGKRKGTTCCISGERVHGLYNTLNLEAGRK